MIDRGTAPHAVLTNETIFELRGLPRSVAVVGAGPLGLELAQALARLGVETEVFEQSDQRLDDKSVRHKRGRQVEDPIKNARLEDVGD